MLPFKSTTHPNHHPAHPWRIALAWLWVATCLLSPLRALGGEQSTPEITTPTTTTTEVAEPDVDDPADKRPSEEQEAIEAAVARPVPADPIQVFGWREKIQIEDIEHPFHAKLDTGALTSSIHAEDVKLFERDGAKWARFITTDPQDKSSERITVEAPLVRYARIKNIGGGESDRREVVRLRISLGKRSLRGEFTLADRKNMLVPVLIGRSMIKELGWIDSSRTYLAEQEVFR